jgi:hypothetical protein
MMIRPEIVRHDTRILEFGVCRFLETYRKGLYRSIRQLRHEGNDDTGVKAAT